jgi:hypothetical protein
MFQPRVKLKKMMTLKQQGKCLWWITQIEAHNPDFRSIPKPQHFIPLKNLKDMATDLGDPWECLYHFPYGSVSKLVHPSVGGRCSIRKIGVRRSRWA